MNAVAATERLVSADSHVHFTDEWVKARLPQRLHKVWDEAAKKQAAYEASELRRGQKQLSLEDSSWIPRLPRTRDTSSRIGETARHGPRRRAGGGHLPRGGRCQVLHPDAHGR